MSPPLLHTKSDLPYTSLIQTSRANVNVLLALYHAACLYNNWSQSAHAAHTCWCLHIPCKKLATTDEIQEPNLVQLKRVPFLPPTPLANTLNPCEKHRKSLSQRSKHIYIPSSPSRFGGPDVARFICNPWNVK